MTRAPDFVRRERVRAAGWKHTSPGVPEQARAAASRCGRGVQRSTALEHCLPAEFSEYTLLPDVRWSALALFARTGATWHDGVHRGPSNDLLGSQVQCVNALTPMVFDADRVVRAFGDEVGTAEVLEIEPGHHLTFATPAADAAFLQRHVDGATELVLVDWNFAETPRPRTVPARTVRAREYRFAEVIEDADGPLDPAVLALGLLTDDAFHPLVRQQVAAHRLAASRPYGAERVRVLRVAMPDNDALAKPVSHPAHRALGRTVGDVWRAVLRDTTRFSALSSAHLLSPSVTSAEYARRYADPVVDSSAALLHAFGATCVDGLGDVLHAECGLDADVVVSTDGVELVVGRTGTELAFPFVAEQLRCLARELATPDMTAAPADVLQLLSA